jgi:acetoin utilization deacetylase AcuC-like enzyme
MKVIYSDTHALYRPAGELRDGTITGPVERPERASRILEAVKDSTDSEIIPPKDFGTGPILRVHDSDYVEFLASAWDEFTGAGRSGELVPMVWPVLPVDSARGPAHGRRERSPGALEGRLGLYALSADTPINGGTWKAALTSAYTALTGAKLLRTEADEGIFALCRPPGHHADRSHLGGYCFFNNAAVAAQYLLDGGAGRIAVLDVDFHHGNGTQSIFYDRRDVLFLSIHGDPDWEFPYFTGYAGETGSGPGEGFNRNFPLPPGIGFSEWFQAFETALSIIADYLPDFLVVSLGVDTFYNDPISSFSLEAGDYSAYGRRLRDLGIPTLFVMEGGYDIESIGKNVIAVLEGFEGG